MDPFVRRLLWLLVAAALLALPATALAQDDEEEGEGEEGWKPRQGFYVQVDVPRYTIETFDPGDPKVDNAFGAGARAGYRVHRWVSVEAQLDWTGDLEFAKGRELDMKVMTANAKLHLGQGRFQPFIGGGIGLARGVFEANKRSKHDHDFVMRGAGGFDFYFNPVFGMSTDVSYVYPTGSLNGRDYVSIGWGLFIVY